MATEERRMPPLTQEAISGMTITELNDSKSSLELSAAVMKDAIAQAQQQRREGEYTDPDWYRRVNFALRMKGREMQMIAREFGARKLQQKREDGSTWEHRFLEKARELLEPEIFQAIKDAVRQDATE